jgi:hypothetical protein
MNVCNTENSPLKISKNGLYNMQRKVQYVPGNEKLLTDLACISGDAVTL